MKKLTIAIPVIMVALIAIVPQGVDGVTNNEIPSWVKNLAMFWVGDQISDEQFVASMSYLIEMQIVKVPIMESLKQENTQLKMENLHLKESLTEQNNEKPTTQLTPEAKPPIQKLISVSTDKSTYQIGESISIVGEVGEILSSKEVLVTIKDSNQNDVYLKSTLLDENQKFSLEISDSIQYIDKPGKYSITAQYQEKYRIMTIYINVISS